MHPKHLDLLCCPETGESLTLCAQVTLENGMVLSGSLSTASGKTYPIIRGVPRFVDRQQYAASFGWEWSRWPRVQFESANVGRPMEGHTTRMWDRITGYGVSLNGDDVCGRRIVDFGCGPGRFLDIVRRRGGIAVGIDLSDAVDAARANFSDDPDVLIVQGDLLRPPFREGAFDGGFSIGVLHHTPEPERGVAALARAVRPGGWVSCCVYPKDNFYDYPSVARFRRIHHALSPAFEYLPALIYSYVAAYVIAPALRFLKTWGLKRSVEYAERHWLVAPWIKDAHWRVLDTFDAITPDMATTHTEGEVADWLVAPWIKDAHWRVLDTFDAITPDIATTHTEAEVADWLTAAGCESVRRTPWCETSAVSLRGPVPVIDVQPAPMRLAA